MKAIPKNLSIPEDWANAIQEEADRRGLAFTTLLLKGAAKMMDADVVKGLTDLSQRGPGRPRKQPQKG